MQAAILPLSAGWSWVQDGYRLFIRQPTAMFFWSLVTGTLINLSYLLPIIGQIALIAATPTLTFITLCACRRISAGERMTLDQWLQPLREDKAVRSRLLRLGMVYLACCMTAGLLATLPWLADLRASIDLDNQIDEHALIAAMRGPLITFGILYVLLSALFWHAPALTGWHAIRIGQAMFYSMVACWRNKFAFLVYGASWAAIFILMQLAANLLVTLGLPPSLVQLVFIPVHLAVVAVVYCSFYPAYISVFGSHSQPQSTAP